jgi:hypothetical protein
MLFQDLTTVITPPSTSETTSFQASNYNRNEYYEYYITWVSGPKPPIGTTITVTSTVTIIGLIVGTNTNGTVTLDTSLASGILNKGQAIVLSGYGFPVNGLTASTYYIISASGTSVVLANSLANAMAGTAITSITSTGSGISSVGYSTDSARSFPPVLIYGDYTNAGTYYYRIGGLYSNGIQPTSTSTLTCTYVTNRTYTDVIYAGLPNYSYIIGSYYNSAGRYSTLTNNIWARGSGTTTAAYPQNLNLYGQYSNFELSNDLTGNYIGNILYELDCVMDKPSTSNRLYTRYLENGTSNIISSSTPLGSSSVPLASNYTITVVDNATNAILSTESSPTALTIASGYAAIGTGYADNNTYSVDYIIKIYAYDDPYNTNKLFSRLRAEDRFPVLNLRPKMWVTPNTFTYPVTQDGSLIVTNSTSTNTNSYSDTIVTCLDYQRKHNTTSSTALLTYYPQLSYMGYNDQDTASLKYSSITKYNFSNIVEVFNAYFNAAKTTVTVPASLWDYITPYPGMIMEDTYDWTTPTVTITAVSYAVSGDSYTFTLSSAWTGTARVGFNYDNTVRYNEYTKDPASTLGANGLTPSTLGYSYYYRQANENRYLSPGFFTILPLYSVKKLDGTLIGTFRDTTLFTEITSPTPTINRNYTPSEITGNTAARWWTPGTTTDYSALPPTKSAKLLRSKIQEFYYTYGPCIVEFTAVILKRVITSGQQVTAKSPTGTANTGYVVGANSNYYGYVASVKGYTETETTEIIRIKVQETVVPMITPPVRIIRPSSLIAFSTTAADYKIGFNAARVITRYKDSNKILIESINTTTNTITITNHGLKDNQIIRYGSYGTVAKGLKNNYYYYVVYYTANTFGLKMDSTAIDITSTGSPGNQYIYLDSDRYILTTQLSKISNSVISFDKPHNLTSGDRVIFLAQSSTNISSYINLVHYTYYIVNRVNDYAIKLLDTTNNPITITATPTIYPINITASKSSNTSNYWNGSYTIDSAKDLVQINIGWSVPWNVDYYTFNIDATSSDAINYQVYSSGNYINGNYGAEMKVTTPTGTYYSYGSSLTPVSGTIAAGATSRTISIQVKSLVSQGYTFQQGTFVFYVKFTKGTGVYLGNFTLAKLPDTVQEVTDKNAGYIGINTETATQATPSKILSGLTGTNLNVKLYADKTIATQLNSVNIPIISNLSSTNAITFQNSAAFYNLTEVGFLPTGADIKHYGIPQSNNNWNYVQYNTTNGKLNNKSTYSTSNGDISINTNTSILGSSGSPANTISATGHGLSTGAPVRISTYNQTTINATNYNAITRVKRNGGGTGSWLGLASAHDYITGDIIMYQKGYNSSTATYLNLLSVLIPGRKYYISVVDTNWFKLCNSPEEAVAGKGITFNSFGKFGTQIVEGVDTKTATIYFKYAQTAAANAVNYYYGTEENPVSAIYNQTAYDKTTVYGVDNSTFRFKYPGPDSYSQQVYTTSTGSTLATSTFDNIVIGYLDKLTTFPKGINCYDTYYVIVVDASTIRLAKNYADAMAATPNYILIEPATTGTTAYIYTGVIAPTAITGIAVIRDEILLGTQNPLALSICWAYTPGTTDTSANNIDGFIVYVNTAGTAGSDPVNDYRYIVPYNDYYVSGKYNIVIYNLPKLTSNAYVAVAAYRYRNHYDYRHNVFFGTDAQEFQRSKLLKGSIVISSSTSDTTALTLGDGTTYTTVKRFFIPKIKLAYNGSQGYATPQSTLTIDGVAGTISLTKNSVTLSDADLQSKYTTQSTASYYIPYLSTSGTYQYISSKETIYYSSKTALQTYVNTTDSKKALFINFIPSNFTGISGITLNSSITAPVLINNVSIDTVTSASTGSGSTTTTQKVISIGPTIVQNATQSLRLLIPVIDSTTNAVSIAEVYYQAKYSDLPSLNFTTIIEVLGT